MITTLSIEGRLNTFLREQGNPSIEFIVALLPDNTISPSRLRQGLCGNKPLENRYHAPLDQLLLEMKALASEHYPVPIRWGNPELFRRLLGGTKGPS